MSNFFKVTLFSALCAIVCTIGFAVTNISVVAVVTSWLWLITYAAFVAWICSKIYKRVRHSVTLIFVIASFAAALYFGARYSFSYDMADINELFAVSMDATLFVVFALLCLASIIIFIAQLVFGAPKKNQECAEMGAPAGVEAWTCSCGCANTENFCVQCGAAGPSNDTSAAK